MTSLKWVKRITGIGLCLMSPETQKERMNTVFSEEGVINGPALAALIDECKTSAGLFLKEHSGILGAGEENIIREVLEQTDGQETVANMADEEDCAWLLELREKVISSGLRIEDLKDL